MARLPAVLEVLSRLDGRSVWSMETVARALREAGYLPPSQSGWGAEHVRPPHAAVMLIALMGTDAPSASAEVAARYWPLRSLAIPHHLPDPLSAILRLPFGPALAGLLEAFPTIVHETRGARWELTISRPFPVAELRIREGTGIRLVAQWCSTPDAGAVIIDGAHRGQCVNKITQTTVTEETFSSLSALTNSLEAGE